MSCDLVISAKLVPVGYGIKKLQIGCVVEDDKVSGASRNTSLVTGCFMIQRLNFLTFCRWAQTSWRRRSQSSRTLFSQWMLLLLTRSEYTWK